MLRPITGDFFWSISLYTDRFCDTLVKRRISTNTALESKVRRRLKYTFDTNFGASLSTIYLIRHWTGDL
jgi:hypothetical protein